MTTTAKSDLLVGADVETMVNEEEEEEGEEDGAEEILLDEETPKDKSVEAQLDTMTDITEVVISNARVTAHHQGVESGKLIAIGNNTFTEYEILVESKEAGIAWTVFRRFTHFKYGKMNE